MSQPTNLYDLDQADQYMSDLSNILLLCPFYKKFRHEGHVVFHLGGEHVQISFMAFATGWRLPQPLSLTCRIDHLVVHN